VAIRRWLGATAVAVVAALAASFSGPMGLLSWPLGFGLVILALWRSNRKIPTALTWIIVGFAATGLYFHDYHSPPQHVGMATSQYVRTLAFFLSALGSAVTTKNQVALVVGSLSCAAIVAALTALVRRRLLEQRLFWVASVCLGLGTLGMVAYGRAGVPEMATRSAYTTYSLFALAAGLPLIVEALPAGLRHSRIAMLAAVIVLGLGVASGNAIGCRAVMANRAALRQLREAILDHCNRPDGDIAPLYRDTDVIRSAIGYLEPRRYSVFAGSKQGGCRIREAPVLPPCKYGTAIHFGLGEDSRPYEGSGWSIPEEGFTWTDGPKATLRLLVGRPTRDLTPFFTVPFAYTKPGRVDRQRVIVGLNGIEVSTVVVAGPGQNTLGIPGRLVNAGENVLAFDLLDARSSVVSGRRLGVALHSIRLE